MKVARFRPVKFIFLIPLACALLAGGIATGFVAEAATNATVTCTTTQKTVTVPGGASRTQTYPDGLAVTVPSQPSRSVVVPYKNCTTTVTTPGSTGTTTVTQTVTNTVTGTTTQTTTPPPPGEPAPIAGQGYAKVFGDEFDVFSTTVWDKDLWWKSSPLDAVAAENGVLHLRSRQSQGYPDVGIVSFDPNDQTPNRSFLLGYFETRLRWTVTPGAWPAFWMGTIAHAIGPPSCPYHNAELDLFEGQGDEPSTFYGTVHKNTNGVCGIADQTNQGWQQVPTMVNAFHVYSARWTATQICWYFDEVQTHCATPYPASGPNTGTNQASWLALEMQANGWDATNQTSASSPAVLDLEVDWVHVWQQ